MQVLEYIEFFLRCAEHTDAYLNTNDHNNWTQGSEGKTQIGWLRRQPKHDNFSGTMELWSPLGNAEWLMCKRTRQTSIFSRPKLRHPG